MLSLLLVGAVLWYVLHLLTPRETTVSQAAHAISVFAVFGACLVWFFSVLGFLWKGKA